MIMKDVLEIHKELLLLFTDSHSLALRSIGHSFCCPSSLQVFSIRTQQQHSERRRRKNSREEVKEESQVSQG